MDISYGTLRTCSLFRDLDETAFQTVLPLLQEVEFAADHPVFTEGGGGRALYFIAQGGVRLLRQDHRGGQVTLAVLGEGEVFGEMSLISEAPRSASAVTTEPTVLWQLKADGFASLAVGAVEAYTTILYNLTAVLCWRLTNATTAAVSALERARRSEANDESADRRLAESTTALEQLLSTLRESGRRLFDGLGLP